MLGVVGSAIFPFMTGALAQKYTPAVLQPVMISLFVVLCGLWFFVPVAHEGDKEE
jgi:fucose permease